MDYECKRLEAAETLGCRVIVLDNVVAGMRPKEAEEIDLQGREIVVPDVEPWPEAVNGAEVLDRVVERIELYLVLPPGAAVVMALWCLATYLYDCFDVFPRLNISSPTKRCGKSLLKDVLSLFCQRACKTEDATPAALFRIIPRSRPTVFWDEFDTLGEKVDELRALLNAGYRKGGEVWRCVGADFEPRAFDVFTPVCVIGIGNVYETLLDRSVTIRMERATKAEIKKKKRFKSHDLETEKNLARHLARFASDSRAAVLAHCDPELPEEIYSREADNLRPLANLAEIVGEGWPLRLITAYANLRGDESIKGESDGLRVELLRDIREVLQEWEHTNIFSQDLTDSLCRMPDRPWHELNRGKDISSTWLAKQLKTFRIISKSVRVGDDSKKGYRVADFEDAFERYLDPDTDLDVLKRHSVTEPINIDESKELETSHANECDGAKSHEKPVNIDVCRRDVSNAENGNRHKSETAENDPAWIDWREKRLLDLGKTQAEILAMTAEEKDEFLFHTF
jgi:putative DNA primase/helicase